jgi:hypothetical protein
MFYGFVWVQGTLSLWLNWGVWGSIQCRNGKCNLFYSAFPICLHVWYIGRGEILPLVCDVYENSVLPETRVMDDIVHYIHQSTVIIILVIKIYPLLITKLHYNRYIYIVVYIFDKDVAFITCLGSNKKCVYLMLLYICI